MRSPNHLEVKNSCKKAIPKLMYAFNLGEIESVRADELGWVNPIFFVNDKYVFRFNARDLNLPKLQREKIAFSLLKKTNIPVPQLIALDDSKSNSPFDVAIIEKIDGINVESDWPNLSFDQRTSLAEQAGKILKTIHSIELNTFGDLVRNELLPQTKDWFEYLYKKVEFHLREARDLSLFTSSQNEQILSNLNSFEKSLGSITQARLIHVDFHFGNLLHKNGIIVGVLDFEWSLAGDPIYDLCSWNLMDEIWPGSQAGFLRGYGKDQFEDQELSRMELYQMIRNIELCVVAKKHFTSEESEDYLRTTIKQIEALQLMVRK